MPAEELTPEQAAKALHEMSYRRRQVVVPGLAPWWLWLIGGAVLATQGVVLDLWPAHGLWVTEAVVLLLLAFSFASRSRRVGSILGYRAAATARARRGAVDGRGAGVLFGLIIIIIALNAGGLLLAHFRVHWPNTVCGIGIGLVATLVLPRILARIHPPLGESGGHVG